MISLTCQNFRDKLLDMFLVGEVVKFYKIHYKNGERKITKNLS